MSCKGILLSSVPLPEKMDVTDAFGKNFIFPEDTGMWFSRCSDNDWSSILDQIKDRIPQFWYEFNTINTYSNATDNDLRKRSVECNERVFLFLRKMIEEEGAELLYVNLWADMEYSTCDPLHIFDLNINSYIGKDKDLMSELIFLDNEFYRFVLD